MNRRHVTRLNDLALDAARTLRGHFERMTDAELADTRTYLEGLTQSNCAWQLYKARWLMLACLHDELVDRSEGRAKASGPP